MRAGAALSGRLALSNNDLETLSVNTIRTLCMDAIQAGNSGRPGTPIGIAPVAYTLWQRFLGFAPTDPIWPNRDRFVLPEGHPSALLWSLDRLLRPVRRRVRQGACCRDHPGARERDRP
ncbi:hypothetical protein ACIHCV_15825 [Streptomyces sp. NPDC051956]|uniref:hypothetical protein n=1 Tax=Streptomyces sp. NPDC051956 TaxID=3365677 RepID=UPI0037D2A21F